MFSTIILTMLQLFAHYQCVFFLQPIKEEEPKGTFVSNLKSFLLENNLLLKSHLNSTLFSLFGKSSIKSLLEINRITGILITKTKIDVDSLCDNLQECCLTSKNQMIKVCSIEFLVKTSYSNKEIKIFKFNFLIEDINDNAPQFKEKIFVIETKENQLPAKIATLPSAVDKDFGPNSKLEYRLNGNKNDLKYFSIKNFFLLNEHKLELYSHVSFDRESISEYNFELIAKDNDDKETKLNLKIKIIDENDSVPKFHLNSNQISKLKIPENCDIGLKMFSFNVTDADEGINGNVYFSLKFDKTNIKNIPFAINKNGLLFVSDIVDREVMESYDLTVVATDGGIPAQMSSVKVSIDVVDVNDNKPEFFIQSDHILNHFTVEENSDIDTNIGTVEVTDKDKGLNAKVVCHIEENSYSKFLKLEKIENFNIFKIQTKAAIDREMISQLFMVMKCRDSGDYPLTSSVTITIDVIDLNDNYPIVDSNSNTYNWEIAENNIKYTYINHIKASDLDAQENGRLYYFINESDSLTLSQFSVDSDLGIVKSKVVFDRELQDVYKFTVFIRDHGKIPLSSSISVTLSILDENDNAPMFFTSNPLYLSIFENTIPPFVVAQLNCKDQDQNANAEISLMLQENTEYFSLLENGILSLKKTIDREIISDFKLKVIAKDHGIRPLFSSLNVVIEVKDINDNAPEFIFPPANFKMNVSFDYTIGKKLITRIVATDSDAGQNGIVTFDHEEVFVYSHNALDKLRENKKYFSINKSNGEITLINSLQPLFNKKRLLIIYARDMGVPSLSSSVKIEITVMDTRNSLFPNKASSNSEHDIFNISVIVIGCISVVIITVMIGAVMMLIFQKERIQRQDADSCLMTSLSGKVASAINEYELSSRSSINKNLTKSLSNLHLIQDNNYLSNIRPVKFNLSKHSNQNQISNYYEVIIPKDSLNNQTFSKDFQANYQAIINNESQLTNVVKINKVSDSDNKICFDETSLV